MDALELAASAATWEVKGAACCLALPPPSRLRHSLCLVFSLLLHLRQGLYSWLRGYDTAFALCFHCLRGYDTAFCLALPPPSRPRHCLCFVFSPPSRLRQCLCLVLPLLSQLRHCLCLVLPLHSRLRHGLWLVFLLPSHLRQCLCSRSSGRGRAGRVPGPDHDGGLSAVYFLLILCPRPGWSNPFQ